MEGVARGVLHRRRGSHRSSGRTTGIAAPVDQLGSRATARSAVAEQTIYAFARKDLGAMRTHKGVLKRHLKGG